MVLSKVKEKRMKTISMANLVEVMKNSADIIDVRETFEYEAGHVPTARNIPMSEMNERYGEIKNGSYIICQSGARSAQVCQWLTSKKIDVTNVIGGTNAWEGCLAV